MESRKRELIRAHSLQTALKVKDSKTGQTILKDNVFEDTKLEGEINQINYWQRKEASRLRWEKECAIRGLRKNLLRKEMSNPDVLSLPPINEGLTRTLQRTQSDGKQYSNLVYLSSEDSSPERSPHNSLEDVFDKPKTRKRSSLRSHSEVTSLPALISPQLMRKATTNDPRFTNLMRHLVPRGKMKCTSEEDDNGTRERVISDLEQPNEIQQ